MIKPSHSEPWMVEAQFTGKTDLLGPLDFSGGLLEFDKAIRKR